ncbi:hypothetical protein HY439_00320 [Candidatus Microgenomates bacterium]|nr:hypothetical protein [Candidatus Microgenomates bacterium]
MVTIDPVNLSLLAFTNFFPRLLFGLAVLIVGIVVAYFAKWGATALLDAIRLEKVLKRYKVPEGERGLAWSNIIGEIVRWFIIILFLIPTVEIWGIPKVTEVLNQILLYLPNVLVTAIIIFLGMVIANLIHDVVHTAFRGVSDHTANMTATVAKWAIIIFVALVALNQLGIASDLIRILFTGIVAMIALAGGIAFGLGGKDAAGEVIRDIKDRLR